MGKERAPYRSYHGAYAITERAYLMTWVGPAQHDDLPRISPASTRVMSAALS